MAQVLSPSRISYFNLKRKPFRSVALAMVVAILSFAFFGGTVLSLSLKNGLNNVKARLGADLIVVPLGYEEAQESILLTGEPSYFYFNKQVADKLKAVEGISELTAQFYLASMSTSCCDLPVQIIGFDPVTDFSIQPWIRETIGGELDDGALIIGSDILLENHDVIMLYGREYPVAAQLDKTGTGMDRSIFAATKTIKDLFAHAKEKGMFFLPDTNPDTSVSSVLIKVEKGYDIDEVMNDLRGTAEDIQIIRTQHMITSITGSIGGFITFLYVFSAVFLVLIIVILAAVFSITLNARKKEFATLRILGATRKKLAAILLCESLYISTAGGMIGLVPAALLVFPFSVFIGDSLGLPYMQPSLFRIFMIFVCTLFLSMVTGPIASVYSAVKICRIEPYLAFREGE